MNPNPERPSAKRERLEIALQALLEERRTAGSPLSEEEAREYTRLLQKLGYPGLEVTPEGWTAQALRLIGAPTRSESMDAAPSALPRSPEGRTRDAFSDVVQDTASKVRDALAAVRGVLVFDTALEPLAGIRSAQTQPRQILIAYPVGRLYLQMERKDDRLDLIGQFIPTDRSGLPERRTAQVTAGADIQEVPLPESGEFRFQLPLELSLDLYLRWGEATLTEHVQS